MKLNLDWQINPQVQVILKQLSILQKNLKPLVTDEVKQIWLKTRQAPKEDQIKILKSSTEVLLKKIEKEVVTSARPIKKAVQTIMIKSKKQRKNKPAQMKKKKGVSTRRKKAVSPTTTSLS
ncbi:MAG: hypothetical protein NZ480_09515 [Bdellovibrionaceae bacterium]|nr:hypothetical protein [Pseudobdellovibrionaceae bacterium]MDW8189863.1 hypothetical protein [Pseudobdellovibrionaceae bacterium]